MELENLTGGVKGEFYFPTTFFLPPVRHSRRRREYCVGAAAWWRWKGGGEMRGEVEELWVDHKMKMGTTRNQGLIIGYVGPHYMKLKDPER